MKDYLNIIAEGGTLTQEQAEAAMHLLLRGEAEPEAVAGLLLGLRARGETIPELVGFTKVMRAYAVPVEVDDPRALDIVGTGGDRSGTFNISTAAAFVCAGAGATVAKHGNRSISSKCGAADVLEALGVNVALGKEGVERCLQEAGIAFLFAPLFHPALRFVMPVRRKLGVRTFFNILGPLCNPAGVRHMLVGAFDLGTAQAMAGILAQLKAAHVLTLHAEDGLDELSLSAPTHVFEYDARQAQHPDGTPMPVGRQVRPEDHGLGKVLLEELKGGTAEDNAAILRNIFAGQRGPHRDVVVLNAAYALHAADLFDSLDACFDAARESIDMGRAKERLDALGEVSNTVTQEI